MTQTIDDMKNHLMDMMFLGGKVKIRNAHCITTLYVMIPEHPAYILFHCVEIFRGTGAERWITGPQALEYIEKNWLMRANEATRKAVKAASKAAKS